MPTIQEILIEANLSTDQVEQIAAVVTESTAAARAELRTVHMAEMAEKDNAIGDLMRSLVEAKQPSEATVNAILKKIATTFKISNGAAHAIFLGGSTSDLTAALESLEKQGFDSAYTDFSDNAEFFAKAKVSKADFALLVTASMDEMDESKRAVEMVLGEATLKISKRNGFRALLSEGENKRVANLDPVIIAEMAKKMNESDDEDADDMDSSVVSEAVSWERWDRSHANDKQMKKTATGKWMVSKDKAGIDFDKKPVEGEDYMSFQGKGKDAVKAAEAWAKKIGVETVYMAEAFEPLTPEVKIGNDTFAVTLAESSFVEVTDGSGTSKALLAEADVTALKSFFAGLDELAKPVPDANLLDEARVIANQEAAVMLEAALADVAPLFREMRAYTQVKGRLEQIQEALLSAGVFTSPIDESALNEANEAVTKELDELRARVAGFDAEAAKAERTALFEAATKDMAQTTREKVQKLMEASKPKSTQEYSELLEAAVDASKPAATLPVPPVLDESKKPSDQMNAYVRML